MTTTEKQKVNQLEFPVHVIPVHHFYGPHVQGLTKVSKQNIWEYLDTGYYHIVQGKELEAFKKEKLEMLREHRMFMAYYALPKEEDIKRADSGTQKPCPRIEYRGYAIDEYEGSYLLYRKWGCNIVLDINKYNYKIIIGAINYYMANPTEDQKPSNI